MNKYTELKDRHSKELNAFPIGFAFSNKQFEEAKEKLGVIDNNELVSLPSGGFIKKTDKGAFQEMFNTHIMESAHAMKDDEYLHQAFVYELGNHEFCITYDPTDTFDCLGIPTDTIDDRIRTIFSKAKKEYLTWCEEHN